MYLDQGKRGLGRPRPNPPSNTMNFIRSTCRDCGHVDQKPREVTYTHDPATCRHEVVNRRGSSQSISRTLCKQCGTFIDEVPGEFHAQRRAAAARVLDATSNALDVMSFRPRKLGPADIES